MFYQSTKKKLNTLKECRHEQNYDFVLLMRMRCTGINR